MSPRAPLRLATPFAVLLALAAACGGEAVAPGGDVTGTYALSGIDGKAPPQVVSRTVARTVVLTTGSLVVGGDGSFAFVGELRVTSGTAVITEAQTISGSWRRTAGGIEIAPSEAGVVGSGSLAFTRGNTLTLVDRGGAVPVTIEFRK
jgi:hypothetical protein